MGLSDLNRCKVTPNRCIVWIVCISPGIVDNCRMPTMPTNTKCETLGCKAPRSGKSVFCDMHAGKQQITQTRDQFNAMYKTKAWHSIKARQLSIAPLCGSCMLEGRIVPANHVDHVFPWHAIGSHAFAKNWFQSLCPACHSRKTAKEQKGIFQHFTQSGIVEYSFADYARVK